MSHIYYKSHQLEADRVKRKYSSRLLQRSQSSVMPMEGEREKITGPKEILTLWTGPELETGSVIFLTIVMKYLTKSTYGRRRYSSSR